MQELFRAGAAYFGLVFVAGFILGTFRQLVIAPDFGQDLSRIAELPFMIVISYLAARWIVRHYAAGASARFWLGAGIFAFAMLIIVEFLFGRIAIGLTLGAYLAGFMTVPGALGLGAQALLIIFPALAAKARRA